jgi:hypothetical protein
MSSLISSLDITQVITQTTHVMSDEIIHVITQVITVTHDITQVITIIITHFAPGRQHAHHGG